MRIIVDNDASSDDVTALIYLLSHPDIVIEGITIAGTGEAHGPNGAENIADLCHLLGKPYTPIAYGNGIPCDLHGKPFPNFLREIIDNLFKDMNIPKNPTPNITSSAIDLIKNIVEVGDEKVTILATGPLTNIAEFIQTHPQLKDKIEKIVIMGGAVNVEGNIQALDHNSNNTVAEWNIYADPKAAEIVFTSNIPVTLVPLDATNQVPMTKEFYDSLSHQLQPGLKLIYQLLTVIVDNFGMEVFLNHFYLWDPLAAMICFDPEIALTESMPILIELKNARTKCVDKGHIGSSIINVATKIIDAQLILKRFIDEIKLNLINFQNKATPISIFSTPNIQADIVQQQSLHFFKNG